MIPDRQPSPASDDTAPFVEDLRVGDKRPRNRLAEILIAVGWVLIAIKSAVVWWACTRYSVPFHPMWIIGPTIAFAALCTGVYWFGRR